MKAMRSPIRRFEPVWNALSGFEVLASSTPSSFDSKIHHMPTTYRSGVAVILIDALRAATTAHAVVAAGSRGVYLAVKPRSGIYDLSPLSGKSQDWICGGEEDGRAIPGGVIGNSPIDVIPAMFKDKFFKFFSTNGARAVWAVTEAGVGAVFLASLANIELTARETVRRGFDRTWFVSGGFYGSGTIEDTVCAGRGIQALRNTFRMTSDSCDDEARIAVHASHPYVGDDSKLVRDLRHSQVGILLQNIGRGEDLEAVVTGRGMSEGLWQRMASTLVIQQKVSGVSVFVAEHAGPQHP